MVTTRSTSMKQDMKNGVTEGRPPSPVSKDKQFRYLTPSGAKNIQHYKYNGSDASLLYNYIISPSAQWVVDHWIPPYLAPNTITLSGLFLIIISHILMLYYAPNMDEVAPRWVYAYSCISVIIYQILDVADGKQARKTGNSSPLGLLFDHGCDAINVVISSCTFAATMRTGATYWSLLTMVSAANVFFMATWEEYYTGILALPPINGPNEGLAVMYLCYLATAIYGPSFWVQPNYFYPKIMNNQALVLFAFIGSIFQGSISAVIALKALRSKCQTKNENGISDKQLEGQTCKDTIIGALLRLTPYLALCTLSMLWVFYSPSNIIESHPRLIIWTVGLLFSKMAMHMMISHMCEEPYWLLRKTFISLIIISALLLLGIIPLHKEQSVVQISFAFALLTYIHMVYYLTNELASVLNIHIFKVKQESKMN